MPGTVRTPAGGGSRGRDSTTRRQPELPTVIRAVCPNCREVDVTVGEARLAIVDWIEEAICRFTCPGCSMPVERPVAPPLVQVLIRMGVAFDHLGTISPAPPPLSTADLERFIEELSAFDG
ncbi:MAG: hypothetical protein ACRDKW_03495 [Actinomycetota bacterium]